MAGVCAKTAAADSDMRRSGRFIPEILQPAVPLLCAYLRETNCTNQALVNLSDARPSYHWFEGAATCRSHQDLRFAFRPLGEHGGQQTGRQREVDLWKNTAAYNTQKAKYGNMTIDQYIDNTPTVSAISSLNGDLVYLNPTAVNSYGNAYMAALVSHEVLHNLGKNDQDIMAALGLRGSNNEITLARFSCVSK